MSEKEKRSRSANFLAKEKLLLVTLAANFKNILENKKTDTVTNQEKEQAWALITTQFNSQCPDNIFRNKESLKRLYENKKKEYNTVSLCNLNLRKKVKSSISGKCFFRSYTFRGKPKSIISQSNTSSKSSSSEPELELSILLAFLIKL